MQAELKRLQEVVEGAAATLVPAGEETAPVMGALQPEEEAPMTETVAEPQGPTAAEWEERVREAFEAGRLAERNRKIEDYRAGREEEMPCLIPRGRVPELSPAREKTVFESFKKPVNPNEVWRQ
jgi:hypothetical protein